MAVQFPNLADIYLEGARQQETARNNAFNRFSTLGANFGAGMGGIIDRLRKKEAARILDEATENKRRYLAGEVTDEAEKAKLSKLYDIPESEQYLSLAGRVRHLDGDLFNALTERGRQARAHEDEIAKLGGDPRVIKFQASEESLLKDKAQLEQALAKMRERHIDRFSPDYKAKQARLRSIEGQLDQLRSAKLRAIGIDEGQTPAPTAGAPAPANTAPGAPAPAEEEAPVFDELSAEDQKRLLDYEEELATIYDFGELKKRIEELKANEKNRSIRWALSDIEKEARQRTLNEDAKLLEMEQKRLGMEKTRQDMAIAASKEARDYWSTLEKPSLDAADAVASFQGIVSQMSTPENLGQAQENLRNLGLALEAVANRSGEAGTEQIKSLGNFALQLLNLAGKKEITPQEYNAAFIAASQKVQAVANSVNERVNARLKDKTGEKADYGKTLVVTMPEAFAVSTLDKPVSANFGQDDGNGDEPVPEFETQEELDAWLEEQNKKRRAEWRKKAKQKAEEERRRIAALKAKR